MHMLATTFWMDPLPSVMLTARVVILLAGTEGGSFTNLTVQRTWAFSCGHLTNLYVTLDCPESMLRLYHLACDRVQADRVTAEGCVGNVQVASQCTSDTSKDSRRQLGLMIRKPSD